MILRINRNPSFATPFPHFSKICNIFFWSNNFGLFNFIVRKRKNIDSLYAEDKKIKTIQTIHNRKIQRNYQREKGKKKELGTKNDSICYHNYNNRNSMTWYLNHSIQI